MSDQPFNLLQLAELPLYAKNLESVSLNALPLFEVLRRTEAPQRPDWKVAASENNRVLFTQLVSCSDSMRDGYYEYLLAIDKKMILVSWSQAGARIIRAGASEEFSRQLVVLLANRGAEIVTVQKAAFVWAEA